MTCGCGLKAQPTLPRSHSLNKATWDNTWECAADWWPPLNSTQTYTVKHSLVTYKKHHHHLGQYSNTNIQTLQQNGLPVKKAYTCVCSCQGCCQRLHYNRPNPSSAINAKLSAILFVLYIPKPTLSPPSIRRPIYAYLLGDVHGDPRNSGDQRSVRTTGISVGKVSSLLGLSPNTTGFARCVVI